MERIALNQNGKHLGTILCKHCGDMIDTVDTERVHFFYISCERPHCAERAGSHHNDEGRDCDS